MPTPEHLIHIDRLKERLLAGGVAPRHVRRALAELRDHFDDAVRDERAKGLNDAAAEQAAWARLGSEDDIARSIIAQPELRSLPARYPRLIFGAGPVLLWFAAMAATWAVLAVIVLTLQAAGIVRAGDLDPQWFQIFATAACFAYVRIVPLLIGVAVAATAIRYRMETAWVAVGAVLIALLSGMAQMQVVFATQVGERGQLKIGFGVSAAELPSTLGIVLLELALILAPYLYWKARRPQAA